MFADRNGFGAHCLLLLKESIHAPAPSPPAADAPDNFTRVLLGAVAQSLRASVQVGPGARDGVRQDAWGDALRAAGAGAQPHLITVRRGIAVARAHRAVAQLVAVGRTALAGDLRASTSAEGAAELLRLLAKALGAGAEDTHAEHAPCDAACSDTVVSVLRTSLIAALAAQATPMAWSGGPAADALARVLASSALAAWPAQRGGGDLAAALAMSSDGAAALHELLAIEHATDWLEHTATAQLRLTLQTTAASVRARARRWRPRHSIHRGRSLLCFAMLRCATVLCRVILCSEWSALPRAPWPRLDPPPECQCWTRARRCICPAPPSTGWRARTSRPATWRARCGGALSLRAHDDPTSLPRSPSCGAAAARSSRSCWQRSVRARWRRWCATTSPGRPSP